LDSKIGRGTLH